MIMIVNTDYQINSSVDIYENLPNSYSFNTYNIFLVIRKIETTILISRTKGPMAAGLQLEITTFIRN